MFNKHSTTTFKRTFSKCPYEIFLKLPLNMDTWPCLTASLIGVQIWISNWTWIWPILVCHIWFKFTFLIWIHHCWLVQPSSLTESSCLLVLQKRLQLVYMVLQILLAANCPRGSIMLSKVVVVVPGYIRKVSYSKSIKLRLLVSASCRAAALIDESVSYHDQLWISCSYLWCVMSYGRDYICYKFPFSLTLIWFMLYWW